MTRPTAIEPSRRAPRSGVERRGHGIGAQLQPVTVKTHASSEAQNPSHDGESASPHGVVRHSHAPPETTAEQWPPSPHVPSHVRSLLFLPERGRGEGCHTEQRRTDFASRS